MGKAERAEIQIGPPATCESQFFVLRWACLNADYRHSSSETEPR